MDIKTYIVKEIEKHHGSRICDIVMSVLLEFGLVRKETEALIEEMILEGSIRCIDYRLLCIDFDRWHGFLLTNKYAISIYSKNGLKRVYED